MASTSPMARLQLTERSPNLLHPPPIHSRHARRLRPPSASAAGTTRRELVAGAASLVPVVGLPRIAGAAEPVLSEWERVYLPIDPGVVLLDIAFVPDDSTRGEKELKLVSLGRKGCFFHLLFVRVDASLSKLSIWKRVNFKYGAQSFSNRLVDYT